VDRDDLDEDIDDPLEEDRDGLDEEDVDEPEDRRSPVRWRWGRMGSRRSEQRLGMVVSFNRCIKRSYRRSCDQVINGILSGARAKCDGKTGGTGKKHEETKKKAKCVSWYTCPGGSRHCTRWSNGRVARIRCRQVTKKTEKKEKSKRGSKSSTSIKKVLKPLNDLLKV